MERRLRIYLAWPTEQLAKAFAEAWQLIEAGHVPICQSCTPDWSAADRQRLSDCDVLLRWPGESPKCDCAVDAAKVLGLPVYFSLQDCLNDLPKRAVVS